MKIYNSVSELIGMTPLLRLKNLEQRLGLNAKLVAKIESFNPAGSVKDRVALNMIETYEQQGKLTADTVIIEPTSGNTGIGLCAVAAAKGYKTIIVMPDSMSKERILLMKAYGAEVVLTDGALGMNGAIAKAEEIQKQHKNSIIAGQFINPANPQAHYKTTGPEILEDTDGNIDFFVAGVGTGGTISGVGKFLKEHKSNIQIVAVEPSTSSVLSGKNAGKHGLQGIGAGFIPKVLDTSIYDQIITVTDDEAFSTARLLGKTEGILCGISSGAALVGAIKIAKDPKNADKTVVVLLPDTGDRYLSTNLFE